MSLNIDGIDSIQVGQFPFRTLTLNVRLNWNSMSTAILHHVGGKLYFEKRLIGETSMDSRIHMNAPMNSNTSGRAELTFPITSEVIHFIEKNRTRNRLPFSIQLFYTSQDLRKLDEKEANTPLIPQPYLNQQFNNGHDFMIAHSDWISFLKELEWSELELFEIRSDIFKNFKLSKLIIQHLREAETHLRDDNPNAVLGSCYTALDQIAKEQSQTGKKDTKFQILLSKIFENEEDRAQIDLLIKAINGFTHKGRHALERPSADRAEAEFVYRTTLSLFSLISRKLQTLQTK